jgi:hypothetical protein
LIRQRSFVSAVLLSYLTFVPEPSRAATLHSTSSPGNLKFRGKKYCVLLVAHLFKMSAIQSRYRNPLRILCTAIVAAVENRWRLNRSMYVYPRPRYEETDDRQSAFLVEGFSASDWFFARLQEHINCRSNVGQHARLLPRPQGFCAHCQVYVRNSMRAVQFNKNASNTNFELHPRSHVHRGTWSFRTRLAPILHKVCWPVACS